MEENARKISKNELVTLRKLGLTAEQIANMDPDENPFEDKGLGQEVDFVSLLEVQKKFYD